MSPPLWVCQLCLILDQSPWRSPSLSHDSHCKHDLWLQNCCRYWLPWSFLLYWRFLWCYPLLYELLVVNCNWTSFLSLTVNALQGKTCQNSDCFLEGVGQFEPRFQGKGSSSGIFLVSRKLDTVCCLTVQTAPCYVQSFWHNTGVWQTDRRTDGRNCYSYSTAFAMRALRRAVKMMALYRGRFVFAWTPLAQNFV